jgi:hypothetical protein
LELDNERHSFRDFEFEMQQDFQAFDRKVLEGPNFQPDVLSNQE